MNKTKLKGKKDIITLKVQIKHYRFIFDIYFNNDSDEEILFLVNYRI